MTTPAPTRPTQRWRPDAQSLLANERMRAEFQLGHDRISNANATIDDWQDSINRRVDKTQAAIERIGDALEDGSVTELVDELIKSGSLFVSWADTLLDRIHNDRDD